MANFMLAFDITMGHEGVYSKDPEDPGGETYRGISRRFWPNWHGWLILDQDDLKPKPGVNEQLDEDVENFYFDQFWNRFQGEDIADQDIANELFDTGVNMSVNRAVEFLQEALNLSNRNQLYWVDIIVDGGWGPKTAQALGNATRHNQQSLIFKVQNILQGEFYINKMRESSSKERWIGWFNRVTIGKE